MQSFTKCYHILCEFIELTNDSAFCTKVNSFRQHKILEAFINTMAKLLGRYPLEALLVDIIHIL